MRAALDAAKLARGRTRPNPMVGCVVVKGGRIIATGYHKKAGCAHAEVEALQQAGTRARGADIYVTLEPCSHYGRTGPCCEALIAAGVRQVFVGARDPNPVVDGRGLRRLRQAGVKVRLGILADECRRLNEAFEHFMLKKQPFTVAKMAQSLDGRVATRTGQSRWITGEDARLAGHRLRDELDAIMVGVGTVLADDPELTCRIEGGRDPVRIVVDTKARTPTTSRIVSVGRRSQAPTVVVVGANAAARRIRALERAGADIVVCRERGGKVDLKAMLTELGKRELLSVLIEGGPMLLGAFFDARLVCKVHAFVAPLILGGMEAKSAVGGLGVSQLADGVHLERVSFDRVGDDFQLIGYPCRP